jgi:aspartate kinase
VTGPGYASRMFRTLFEAGINIELIATSEIRITCLIDEGQAPEAVAGVDDGDGSGAISRD